jgi:hypothetical protein
MYRDVPRQPPNPNNPQQGQNLMEVKDSGDGGLIIDGRGTFRPSGPHTFVLDHPLELDAGFGAANRYVFSVDGSGRAINIYQHINAGRFERADAK